MSDAMRLIVDGYVRLGFSNALEDLLNHRRAMARQLQFRSTGREFNLEALTTTIDKEIALIEEGIEKIKSSWPGAQRDVAQQINEIGARPAEATSSLIDTVIDLVKNRQEPRSIAVQPQENAFTETAGPDDPVLSDEAPRLFRKHSMGGQFTYRWGGHPRDSDSGET
jgi:hypothetical protein